MSTSVVRTTNKDFFMLWFDDSGDSFEKKKAKAIKHYRRKYKIEPNVFEACKPCYHYRVAYIPKAT